MGIRPCFLRIKSSVMPLPMGPGRYKAIKATISENSSGLSFFKRSLIPEDSIWNTPTVWALLRRWKVFSSSRGILLMSISIFSFSFRIFRVLPMTVRLRRPRKSILSNPMASKGPMAYWVAISSRAPLKRGTWFVRGSLEITIPAAWVEAWRTRPSSNLAISTSLFTFSFFLVSSFNSGTMLKARSMVMPISGGMSLAILSTSEYGILRLLPTSLTTARAFMVPKVAI
ncbi:hypothetical protein ES703_29904 [subsurface metagenome]